MKMRSCAWAMVALLLLANIVGCAVGTTPTRKQAETVQAADYEQTYANEAARADSLAAANVVNHTRRMDLELKIDLQTLATQAKADPATWTPVAIAAETARLQALHDAKIAAYNSGPMAASAALRTKNEEVNLAAARKLRDAMNPPDPVKTQPVNLVPAVQATTGQPAPGPLVVP